MKQLKHLFWTLVWGLYLLTPTMAKVAETATRARVKEFMKLKLALKS